MSRDWFAVYSRILRLPKFRRLSHAAQLALLYVWGLAGDESPEATWLTTGHLAALLEFYGHERTVVDELVNARFLDVDDSGAASVHDWDDHQLAATVSARRAWEAAYMRKWRRERKAKDDGPLPPSALPPSPTRTAQDRTEPPTRRPRVNNAGMTRAGAVFAESTTCPGCGDLVSERDPNVVVVDRMGRLGHRECPAMVAAS